MSGDDSARALAAARAALENGKGALEAQKIEAALKHFDRAVLLSTNVGGDELVGAEATFRKGQALFSEARYAECGPHLRAYLDQDPADALGFNQETQSFLAIAEMEAGDTQTISVLSSDAPGGASPSQVDMNPVSTDVTMRDSAPPAFDGRLSAGRLRTSGGRTYSGPEPQPTETFERDSRRVANADQRQAAGGSDLAAVCCGETEPEKCLCGGIVIMLSMISIMLLYGIVA